MPMVALIVPTGYLWTKLGGLRVTMMVIYVVVLAVSILPSILPVSGDQRTGPCCECHHRATIVAGYVSTPFAAQAVLCAPASLQQSRAMGMVTMSWKSVVKQCRFDCVGTGLFSVANMVFLLVFRAVYRGIAGDDIDPRR